MKYHYDMTKNTYLTPQSLIKMGLQILALNKGEAQADKFDCDVCCSNENVPALEYYKYGQKDGLKEDWKQYNWCNPPFNECKRWVQKAYNEQSRGNTTVMLIPARTETAYYHDYILHNDNVEITWLRKGYRFVNPDTGKEMGIFKNALALILFKGVEQCA